MDSEIFFVLVCPMIAARSFGPRSIMVGPHGPKGAEALRDMFLHPLKQEWPVQVKHMSVPKAL